MHPGASHMEVSLKDNFTRPLRKHDVKEYVKKCKVCQITKRTNKKKEGKIPLKTKRKIKPFETLTVDLCRPWPIKGMVKEKGEDKASINQKKQEAEA